MATAHELVARGAELLDEQLPGWADAIDLERLDMSHACHCVLGQIGTEVFNLDRSWHPDRNDTDLSPFWQVEMVLGIESEDYGFEKTLADGHYTNNKLKWVEYDELQDAWKGEIVARRTPFGSGRG